MKRSILVAFAALAAAATIGAGGAASAPVLSAHTSNDRASASPGLRQNSQVLLGGGQADRGALSAKAHRLLQAAGDKDFVCEPASGTPVNNDMQQTCVITAPTGTCIQKSDSPVVVQTCTFTQLGGTASKHATAIQVAATNKGPSPQRHTQVINVEQTSTLGSSNFVDATQTVKQSLGPGHFDDTEEAEAESVSTTSTTPPITNQDFHQIVTVDQTAVAGNNTSDISQFGKQRVRAKHAPSISQFQNTMLAMGPEVCPASGGDPNANQCSDVHQKSGTGDNFSNFDSTYLQFERAHKTTEPGTQQQGISMSEGGLDHEVFQESTGFCKIVTNQTEHQVMRAVQADETQVQHGPTRKGSGSSQLCNADSVWTGQQDSSQLATSRPNEEAIDTLSFGDPAFQDNLMQYFGDTTGDIRATQTVKQQTNNTRETEQNSCPSTPSSEPNQFCFLIIECTNSEFSLAAAQPAASEDPNRCQAIED